MHARISAIAAVAALAVVAAPAAASTVSVSGDTITILGTDGNDLSTIGPDFLNGSLWVVTNATPGPGCVVYVTQNAKCTNTGVTRLVYSGGAGNDKFGSSTGSSSIVLDYVEEHGGPGDDFVQWQSTYGHVHLFGDDGHDTFDTTGNQQPVHIDGGGGPDVVSGTELNDVLAGGDGDDTVEGEGGNDQIDLGPGHDLGVGGPGDDTILGGAGNDKLAGVDGSDTLDGGSGADVAGGDHAWSASRSYDGGWYTAWTTLHPGGNDTIRVRDGERDDYMCGPGQDTVTRDATDALKTFYLSPGAPGEDACEAVDPAGTGTPGPGPGTNPTAGPAPQQGGVSDLTPRRQKLGTALRKGVLSSVEVDRPADIRVSLFEVAGSLAAASKLRSVGRYSTRLDEAGAWNLRTYLKRSAKRRFAHRRSVRIVVRQRLTDDAGATANLQTLVTLRR